MSRGSLRAGVAQRDRARSAWAERLAARRATPRRLWKTRPATRSREGLAVSPRGAGARRPGSCVALGSHAAFRRGGPRSPGGIARRPTSGRHLVGTCRASRVWSWRARALAMGPWKRRPRPPPAALHGASAPRRPPQPSTARPPPAPSWRSALRPTWRVRHRPLRGAGGSGPPNIRAHMGTWIEGPARGGRGPWRGRRAPWRGRRARPGPKRGDKMAALGRRPG